MTAVVLSLMALLLQAPTTLPGDTFIQAALKKEITSRRSHPGQPVILSVTDDVKAGDGAVLIPAGAKLTGKLLVSRKRQDGSPSAISFVVDQAEWKNGSMPLNAVIEQLQALGSTETAACGPNLNRASMSACGGATANLQNVPADCSVTQLDEGKAIVCSKRELELGRGSLLILRNNPAVMVAK
jgi:hypothetical protein